MPSKHSPIALSFTFIALATATLVQAAPPAESPFAVPQPPFYGQVRLRTEADHKSLYDTSGNKTLINTQLRSRLGFTATPSEKVEVKVEFQDVRSMGTEPNTTTNPSNTTVGNAKGVDLSQGYFAIEEGPVKVALGRQKMQLGAGRFISTLEWSPTSRVFDGAAFNWHVTPISDLTGVFYLVRDTNIITVKDHLLLSGFNYNHKFSDAITADVYSFYDQSRVRAIYGADTAENYDLGYLGQRLNGKVGLFTYDEEFIWQAGELNKGGKDFSSKAFQLSTRVGIATPSDIKFNLGLDMMSGDADKTNSDNTLYRANYYFAHFYYGWMDYFGVNPQFGVMDYRVDGDFGFIGEPGSRKATLKAAYHYFTPQDAPSGKDLAYGQEINAELHLALYPKSNIVLGASAFFQGEGAVNMPAGVTKLAANRAKSDGYYFYFMPVFNF